MYRCAGARATQQPEALHATICTQGSSPQKLSLPGLNAHASLGNRNSENKVLSES